MSVDRGTPNRAQRRPRCRDGHSRGRHRLNLRNAIHDTPPSAAARPPPRLVQRGEQRGRWVIAAAMTASASALRAVLSLASGTAVGSPNAAVVGLKGVVLPVKPWPHGDGVAARPVPPAARALSRPSRRLPVAASRMRRAVRRMIASGSVGPIHVPSLSANASTSCANCSARRGSAAVTASGRVARCSRSTVCSAASPHTTAICRAAQPSACTLRGHVDGGHDPACP